MRSLVVCACIVGSLVLAGCADEDSPVWEEGPSFLVVGRAAVQAGAARGETRMYVQARGGDYAGIVIHGGKSASACIAIHGSDPTYFVVKPESQDVLVEVRLYSLCDGPMGWDEVIPLQTCEDEGAFVRSENVSIPGIAESVDAGADAASDAAGDR